MFPAGCNRGWCPYDNLTFVQHEPPEEPPPSPAPRPREISLWGIDNPYRDAQDWRYEAFRWPADGEADQYQGVHDYC